MSPGHWSTYHGAPRIPITVNKRQSVAFDRIVSPPVDLLHIRPFGYGEVFAGRIGLLADLGCEVEGDAAPSVRLIHTADSRNPTDVMLHLKDARSEQYRVVEMTYRFDSKVG